MRNVKPTQLRKAIFLQEEEFKNILYEIFGEDESGNDIEIDISKYGIWIGYPNSELSNEEITKGLAKYFDVYKVTSIHTDNCDIIGIWIIYQN